MPDELLTHERAAAEAARRKAEADRLWSDVVRLQTELETPGQNVAESQWRELTALQSQLAAQLESQWQAEEQAIRLAEAESESRRNGQARTQRSPDSAPSIAVVPDATANFEFGIAAPSDQDVQSASVTMDAAACGRYHLLDRISSGGTGSVYQARDTRDGRLVALKVLARERTELPELVARFQRKAEILTRLRHPHLVSACDSGQFEGLHFLVLEFVDGESLVEIVNRQLPPVAAVVKYITQAARALAYLHANGVLHRNVRPSNLLVNRDDKVKLIGLGLALFEGIPDADGGAKIVGSPDYTSPEQTVDASKVDVRSDIYSLGCTLYAALTKRPLFPVPAARRKILAHRFQPPPQLRAVRPDVPEALEVVFQRMVQKSPSRRFQTMGEVLASL